MSSSAPWIRLHIFVIYCTWLWLYHTVHPRVFVIYQEIGGWIWWQSPFSSYYFCPPNSPALGHSLVSCPSISHWYFVYRPPSIICLELSVSLTVFVQFVLEVHQRFYKRSKIRTLQTSQISSSSPPFGTYNAIQPSIRITCLRGWTISGAPQSHPLISNMIFPSTRIRIWHSPSTCPFYFLLGSYRISLRSWCSGRLIFQVLRYMSPRFSVVLSMLLWLSWHPFLFGYPSSMCSIHGFCSLGWIFLCLISCPNSWWGFHCVYSLHPFLPIINHRHFGRTGLPCFLFSYLVP